MNSSGRLAMFFHISLCSFSDDRHDEPKIMTPYRSLYGPTKIGACLKFYQTDFKNFIALGILKWN